MAASRNKPSTEAVLAAVAAWLSRYARASERVVVGFSGGLDSTVLLHAASRFSLDADLELLALHIHHGLSIHADEWAVSCESFCTRLSVPFTVLRIDVPQGTAQGPEAAARRVRHQALADYPADWILLAHHADDQAETVLHNLLRGAGVRGAAAMPAVRGRVLRPLLALERSQLLHYAQTHHLSWIEDESNADSRFTRNYLRHSILPLITMRFPRATRQLAAAAVRFNEADRLLEELAMLDLGAAPPTFPMPLELIRRLSGLRAANLLRAMLSWHHVQAPDQKRLTEFVRQLQTAANDRHPRLDLEPYSLWCEAGCLHFADIKRSSDLSAGR